MVQQHKHNPSQRALAWREDDGVSLLGEPVGLRPHYDRVIAARCYMYYGGDIQPVAYAPVTPPLR